MTVIHPTAAAAKQGVIPTCATIDTELYFPEHGQTLEHDQAKNACFSCPVQAECLEWSLHHEEYGVWGGYGQKARSDMRSERGITLAAPEVGVMEMYFVASKAEEGIRDNTTNDLPDGWWDFRKSEKYASIGLEWKGWDA